MLLRLQVDNCRSLLTAAKRVVLAVDTDGPGLALAAELVRRWVLARQLSNLRVSQGLPTATYVGLCMLPACSACRQRMRRHAPLMPLHCYRVMRMPVH